MRWDKKAVEDGGEAAASHSITDEKRNEEGGHGPYLGSPDIVGEVVVAMANRTKVMMVADPTQSWTTRGLPFLGCW
jgi:hypothetical protein